MKRSILSNVLIATMLAQSVLVGGITVPTPVRAETISAHVSAMEFESVNRFGKPGQKIVFHADMPFQYRVDVLNDDQVQLTLQNARLSDALMGGNGLLNIVPGGSVQSAALKPGGAYEQIVLSGPSLGKRDIYIEGAIRAASTPPSLRLSRVTPGVQQIAHRIDIDETPQSEISQGLSADEMAVQPPVQTDTLRLSAAPTTRQQIARDLEALEPVKPVSQPAMAPVSQATAMPTGFLMPTGTKLSDLQKPVKQASADQKTPGALSHLTKKLVSAVQERLPEARLPDLPEKQSLAMQQVVKAPAPAAENAVTALSMADSQSLSREELKASPAFQAIETVQPASAASQVSPSAASQTDKLRLSAAPARGESLGWLTRPEPDEMTVSPPRTSGPQIVEIVSARSKRTYNGGANRSKAVFPSESVSAAGIPQHYTAASPFSAPEPMLSQYTPPAYDAHLPPQTVLAAAPAESYIKALPRYHGGTQPITATVSGTRQIVSYQGTVGPQRKRPVEEPEPLEETLPVNNLFYQESSRDLIERMMAQALTHYRSGNRKAALACLDDALGVEPKHAKLLAAKGEILIEQQRLDEAEAVYEQASAIAPETSLLRYAEVLILNRKQAQARPILEKYVQTLAVDKKSPDTGRAHYMLGTLYQQAGEFPFAVAHLREAAGLNPESADIQYNLGLAYELQGKLTLAQGHYQKAVDLNPAAEDAQTALRRMKI